MSGLLWLRKTPTSIRTSLRSSPDPRAWNWKFFRACVPSARLIRHTILLNWPARGGVKCLGCATETLYETTGTPREVPFWEVDRHGDGRITRYSYEARIWLGPAPNPLHGKKLRIQMPAESQSRDFGHVQNLRLANPSRE